MGWIRFEFYFVQFTPKKCRFPFVLSKKYEFRVLILQRRGQISLCPIKSQKESIPNHNNMYYIFKGNATIYHKTVDPATVYPVLWHCKSPVNLVQQHGINCLRSNMGTTVYPVWYCCRSPLNLKLKHGVICPESGKGTTVCPATVYHGS